MQSSEEPISQLPPLPATAWWGFEDEGKEQGDLELYTFTFKLLPHQVDKLLLSYAESGDWEEVSFRF